MQITGGNFNGAAGVESEDLSYPVSFSPTSRDTLPVPAHNELAPGTAKITGTILQLEKSGQEIILHIQIAKTAGYGPATPPLATGQVLRVDATDFFESADQEPVPESGHVTTAVVRHLPPIATQSSAPAWRLVELVNDQKDPQQSE